MARSRRKAREAALRALYEIEISHSNPDETIRETLEQAQLDPDLAAYAEKMVEGVRKNLRSIDAQLAGIVKEYDFSRVAAIDRNVLRLAAYELLHEPSVPPAVTINEAIEIARKYSTAESGKFVNGILGRLLLDSPKAHWDPATAPPEEHEDFIHEPDPEIQVEVVEEGSAEAAEAMRFGTWKLRSEDATIPPDHAESE